MLEEIKQTDEDYTQSIRAQNDDDQSLANDGEWVSGGIL